MKFKIKYADQIVGSLVLVAAALIILVVFLLGSNQRWFAKDYSFYATFSSANGLSEGMALQYKGFTIGKIKSFSLQNDDTVKAVIYIYDTYYDRAKKGSCISLSVSPIGLGNKLQFFPGNGADLLEEDSELPLLDSELGKRYIAEGLITVAEEKDAISEILAQVPILLKNINETLEGINGAIAGTGEGPLADTLTGLSKTMSNVSDASTGIIAQLNKILGDVKAITANFQQMSSEFANPTGLVPKLIDPDGAIFGGLANALEEVAKTLSNLESMTASLDDQSPQIGLVLQDVRSAISEAEKVIEGVKNNPLIKNGITTDAQIDTSGLSTRNMEF